MQDALSVAMNYSDNDGEGLAEERNSRIEYSEQSAREDGRASARFNNSAALDGPDTDASLTRDNWDGLLGGCGTAERY
jgi:hypothetical protein